jgi:hypothetical protein
LSEAPEIVRERVSPVEYDLLKTAINDIDREGARTFEGEMFQAYNIGPGGVIEESGIEKQACGYDCRAPFEGLRSAPAVWVHSHNRYGVSPDVISAP